MTPSCSSSFQHSFALQLGGDLFSGWTAAPATLEFEALEKGAKWVSQVGARQRELHGGLEESQLLPGVVPPALELHRVDRSPASQDAQAVGELALAAGIGRGVLPDREQIGGQHVSPNDGQVRWGLPRS